MDPNAPDSVEPVLDSSRYFVLRIEDGSGKHAFIGMGFGDRSHAFDFNAALQDFRKHANGEKEREQAAVTESSNTGPKLDLALKAGQTIKVNIGGKQSNARQGGGELAPPPTASGGLAAPPIGIAPDGAAAAAAAADDWGDFGDFANAAPVLSSSATVVTAVGQDDWTSFDD
jgi:hypothetical protein